MIPVSALPCSEPDRLATVCAVLTDVRVADGKLQLVGVASRALPGTRPITDLGLTGEATVGDLVLLLANGDVAPTVPLALA